MAGVPVIGTLGIGVEVDAVGAANSLKQLGTAVQNTAVGMASSMGTASKAITDVDMTFRQAEAAAQRLRERMDPLVKINRVYAEQLKEVSDMQKLNVLSAREAAQAEALFTAKRDQAIAKSKQVTAVNDNQRAGMQQLSFQINDVATQFASGTPPMQIFAQQSGQVIQAVQMMTGGTSALATFLSGPWGIAIVAATVVLVPFIGRLAETAFKADEATAALDRLIKKRREEASQKLELVNAEQGLNKLYEERTRLENMIQARQQRAGGNPRQFQGDQDRLFAVNQKILESENVIRMERNAAAADDERNTAAMIGSRAKLAGATTAADRAQAQYNIRIQEADQAWEKSSKSAADQERLLQARTKAERDLNQAQDAQRAAKASASAGKADQRRIENLQRETVAIDVLIGGLYKSAAAYGVSEAAGRKAAIEAEATAKGMRKQADVADYTAQQLRKGIAEQVQEQAKSIRQMADQTTAQETINKRVGEGAIAADDAAEALAILNEQRALLNTIKLAELNKDAIGAEAARKALQALTAEQMRANQARKAAEDIQLTAQSNRQIDQIRRETELQRQVGEERRAALKGLSGDSLENELARIGDAYELNSIRLEYDTKIAKANADQHFELAKALAAERDARLAQVGQAQGQAAEERKLEQNRHYTLDAAHEVADIIGGKLGQATHALIDALDDAFPDLAADAGEKFGKAFQAFTKGAALGGAVGGAAGSSSGGAIGGGLAGAAFEEFASKGLKNMLGAFGGPLAGIAGGLLGGLIGGMLASTPRASATVSIIAGEAMDVAVRGNSGKLKKIAGEMADGLISGLADIADTLGAQLLGDAKVSVGVRKGNYRVDTSGNGITKTSKGAIDFGEDKAAAVAYAMLDAIRDGALVFDNMSDSMYRLITLSDDLQANLAKATKFKGVFDDLAKADDPAKWAQDEITRWHDSMAKIFAEAQATGEELAALERLTGIKRAEAVKEATEQVAQDERGAHDKRIRILELEGKAQAALDYRRGLELEGLNEVERALQVRIYQLESEAEAAAKQQVIADERYALETRYYQAIGDTAELRRRELATVSETNRPFAELIMHLEGMRDAAKEAADAQFEADTKRRSDQHSAELAILQLTDGERYLKAVREDELRSVDQSVRPLLLRKFALEDEAKAAEKLAAIADERKGLETQWLTLIGDTAELRRRELEQLDPTNRALQEQIWAYEDAQKAMEAQTNRAQELAAAHATITDQYTREIDALRQTADKFRELGKSIADFRRGLIAENSPALAYGQARSRYMNTARLAQFGDEASLSSFAGDAKSFLDLARNRAGSWSDYQREVAMVTRGAIGAERGANGMVSEAERQIAAIQAEMERQTAELETALGAIVVNDVEVVVPALREGFSAAIDGLRSDQQADRAAAATAQANMQTALETIAVAANQTSRRLAAWDRSNRLATTDGD